MDNITHTLVGVLLARAGLNRLAPRAAWAVVAAANLPDLDAVAALGGSASYVAWHRSWTHAAIAAPAVAIAALPFWWLAARRAGPLTRRHWLGAFVAAMAAVASHLVLDALNGYGLRWGLPFTSAWFHADLVSLFDLWILALLTVCTLGPLLGRLVYSEIGARGSTGRGMAWAGLVLMTVYTGARAELHGAALQALNSRLYDGAAARRVLAIPSASLPWRWTGLVETPSSWRVVPVDLTRDFDPELGHTYYKADASTVRAAVAQSRVGRIWLDFAQAPLWRLTPAPDHEGAIQVMLTDLRFGLPGEAPFEARFLISPAGRLLEETISRGAPPKGSN